MFRILRLHCCCAQIARKKTQMQDIRSQALTDIVAAKVSIGKSVEATQREIDAMPEATPNNTSSNANAAQQPHAVVHH